MTRQATNYDANYVSDYDAGYETDDYGDQGTYRGPQDRGSQYRGGYGTRTTRVERNPRHLLPANPPRRDFYKPQDEDDGYGKEAAVGLVGLALAGVGAYLAYRYYFGGNDRDRDHDYDVRGADGQRHAGQGHQGGRDFQDRGVNPSELYDSGLHLHEAVTINKPRGEVYRYFRDLKNQPHFMDNVESVSVNGDGGVGSKSHWTAKGPAGTTFEYDAETIADEQDRLISWRTVSKTAVEHAGTARFVDAPGGRGTEVHLEVQYLPPGGQTLGGFGRTLLSLVGQDPDRQVRRGLRNLQRILETGERPTIQGQPKGNG